MWIAKSIRATNQNRGATIRISGIATARCTRQCASSGSAQPVFWSLPIAIQEFCRTKSATMCLAVSSSIQPTSAATGTDDDMGGNDKADALARTDLERHGQNGRPSAQLLLKSGQFDRYLPFMTSPGPECTLWNSKNAECGLTAICRPNRCNSAGKVTCGPDFAIGP